MTRIMSFSQCGYVVTLDEVDGKYQLTFEGFDNKPMLFRLSDFGTASSCFDRCVQAVQKELERKAIKI